MKNYLLYILILVPFYSLNGMDQNQEDNRFSICNQIKQINPNASRATYREFAKKLSKNNLSTCACITYLMQERERKVIELIKKDVVSQKTENIINELYKQQQQKDANEKDGIPLTIHCSPSLDPDMQAIIIEKFSGKYRPTIVPTEEFCPSGMSACALRDISFLLRRVNIDGSGFIEIMTENPKIGINASCKEFLLNAKNAVLEHEKHHLEANHNIWESAIFIDHIINGSHEEYTVDEKKADLKLDRAHEAAADRIPAACNNNCKLASDFVEDFKNSNLISGFKDNKLFQRHPSAEKRLQWAQRIYNLKLAEHEIEKNFEI